MEEKSKYEIDNGRFKIWFIQFDDNGNEIGRGVYHKDYAYYGRALCVACELYGRNRDGVNFKWRICARDPWKEYFKESKCHLCGKTYDCPQTPEGYPMGINLHLYDRSEKPPRQRGRYISGTICRECFGTLLDCVNSLRKEGSDDDDRS